MENNADSCVEEDVEYVLLDLDNVCFQADIPPNAPYVLSGLDTMNPTLTIGKGPKLVGEYQETIGTCYLFSDRDGEAVLKNCEPGSCKGNLDKDKQDSGDSNQASSKQIRSALTVHKILKFRLEPEANAQDTP